MLNKNNVEDILSLNTSQEGLLYHYLNNPDKNYYFQQVNLQLTGPVDVALLQRSYEELLRAHEALRSVFRWEKLSSPVQIILKDHYPAMTFHDLSEYPDTEVLGRVQGIKEQCLMASSDIGNTPFQITLLKLGEQDHLLSINYHHILFDGWSLGIVIKELLDNYNNLKKGKPYERKLKPVHQEYLHYLKALDKPVDNHFWNQYLKGFEPRFLPKNTSAVKGMVNWNHLTLSLPGETVRKFISSQHITLATFLYGVWGLLLQRHLNTEDVVFGGVVSGRMQSLEGIENMVGMLSRTLPFRISNNGDISVSAYLMQLRNIQDEWARYELSSLTEILSSGDEFKKQREIFDTIIAIENYPIDTSLRTASHDLRVGSFSFHGNTHYDITIAVNVVEDIELNFSISEACKSLEEAHQLVKQFDRIAREFMLFPDKKVGSFEILEEADKQVILDMSDHTAIDYPRDKTIVDLFGEQAAAVPDRIALIWEDVALSYGELDARSNQLACYLRQKGVQPDSLVGICMHRGIDMIIGLLGILKAGGAYLPVDPDYPQDRIRYQLEDSGAALMITTSALATALFSDLAASRLILPERLPLEEMPSAPLPRIVQPEHLAYVIYTSGSTGKPKGVMIEHRQVVRLFVNDAPCYDFGPADTWTLFHSFCFDFSVWEIFGALLFGGKLIIVPSAVAKDSEAFGALLAAEEVTVLNQTPAAFYVLQEVLLKQRPALSLRYLIFGGEALQPGRLLQWQEAYEHCRLINMYGITEITVHATFKELHRSDVLLGVSNIGVAIPTLSALILDKWGHLSPVGCTGELYIGGDGLARGYLNRPELTASRFIADPFQSGRRLYRTGDLARRLVNGEMEYQGRMDDQVKIRGYRIELGEIESVLSGSGLVHQSVVMAREDGNGGKRLVAYVVPVTIFDKEALTGYLKDRLPGYMVPSLWVALTSFPLTSNGKVDKRSLPEPEVSGADEYVGPRTATEQVLAGIWQELLGVDRVGVYDNFFELGGDSIISIQVVSRAQRKGLQLKPRELFEHQTLEALAASIRSETRGSAAEQGVLSGGADLLPVQQLFFEQEYAVASHYNQSMLLEVSRSVAAEDLRKAVAAITAHHDVLRFTYQRSGGSWQQTYGSKEGRLEEADLSEVDLSALAVMIREVCNTYQQSLNLETGELCRWVLIHTPAGAQADRLFIVIHHLAVDGVSWRILLEDLRLCVEALSAGKEIDLGAKSSSYRQYGHALSAYARHGSTTMQQEYWATVIENIRPLPVDFVSSSPLIGDVNTLQVNLGEGLTRSLLTGVHHAYQTEINDLLLSALSRTLQEWSGHEGVVIGLEGHGREAINEEIDTSRTVGWFTNIYPVLLSAGQGVSAADQIKSVKEQLRRLPGKGMGYSALRYLHPSAEVRGRLTPDFPFEILFNYLGQLDNVTGQDGWMSKAKEEGGATISADNRFGTRLAINAQVTGGVLQVRWSYAATDYQESTIRRLAEQYLHHLSALIRHCQEKETGEHTPSDFGLQESVSYQAFDSVFNARQQTEDGRLERIYALSPLQEGILFHSIYNENSGAYIIQFKCELSGLDAAVFRRSWNHLLKKHSVLRTAFKYKELPVPVQCVYSNVSIPFDEQDWRGMPVSVQKDRLAAFLNEDREKGFEFNRPPLMRINLFRLADECHQMVWTIHHLICDGWSMPVLLGELLQCYQDLIDGNEEPVYDKEDCYQDYIRYISARDIYEQEAFWKGYLEGITSPSLLPFAGTRTSRNKATGKVQQQFLSLNQSDTSLLEHYVKAHHITPSTLIQGVWAYLLLKYTGTDTAVYGVTVAGRPATLPAIEQRVGMYINTIPLYTRITGDPLVTDWLKEIQQGHNQAREHQYTSLREIQQWQGIEGDFFDSILVFENYPVGEELFSNWHLKATNVEVEEKTNYLLGLTVNWKETLTVSFRYDSSLLAPGYVDMIAGHFENVLRQIAGNPALTVQQLEILTSPERIRLLETFSGSTAVYPTGETVLSTFEKHAAANPDTVAVVYQDKALTYRQLNEKADQLGQYLSTKYHIVPGDLAGVMLSRSEWMIVGMLGILKAGAAYVPIDPNFPLQRKQYIISDALLKFLLVDVFTVGELNDNPDCPCEILSDTLLEGITPREGLSRAGYPHDLLYVIYTSGSTGHPKGVLIEHASMLNYVRGLYGIFGADKDTVNCYATVTDISTDLGNTAIYGALCSGKTLDIVPVAAIETPALFFRHCRSRSIDAIKFTPSLLKELLDYSTDFDWSFNRILIGGEALNHTLLAEIKSRFRGKKIYNHYGPTETTIGVLVNDLSEEMNGAETPPIGRPLANIKAYILDAHLKPVPVGVTGSLYIGGAGLARGYLNRPELTAERFITHPFKEGERLYQTGDLARWLPDGKVEYLGRSDDQVKVRGYRIELGEVERVLARSGQIRQGVVLAKKDANGDNQLVAYVVPQGNFNKEELVSFLQERLPGYMVPTLWVILDVLPVTANNKINKQALPEPDITVTEAYAAPRTATEQVLAGIWQELLKVQRVGRYDNFFDLGGHSLLAMRLLAALHKRLEVEVSVRDIFTHPRLHDLADLITQQKGGLSLPPLQMQVRKEQVPLSFSQERLWFIDQLEGSVHYHIPVILQLNGPLNREALQAALSFVVDRHEVLRTVFRQDNGMVWQELLAPGNWNLSYREADTFINEDALQEWLDQELLRPFDLGSDHMLRACLVRHTAEKHQLVVVLHHIASDGWSSAILLKEFVAIYHAAVTGHPSSLPALPVQYADYAIWQRKYLTRTVLEEKLGWWTDRLKGVIPLNLPLDFQRPAMSGTRGGEFLAVLDPLVLQGINKLSHDTGSTPFMVMLAVLKVLLHRYSGQRDICVGTPVAGRYHEVTEGLIGFFLNTLALRSDADAKMPFMDFLVAEREAALAAYAHQEVPFEWVVERVVTDRDLNRSAVFQVLFVFQDTPEVNQVDLGELQVLRQPHDHKHTKFDLTFMIFETDEGTKLRISYRSDLYLPATIGRMAGHYQQLLQAVVTDPQQELGRLKMLSNEEQHQLLADFSGSAVNFPEGDTIVSVFEKHTAHHPEAIAVVYGEVSLSYAALNDKASRLAAYLKTHYAVKRGDLVGLMLGRSEWMIIGILGILKAGAAYVPVDIKFPEQRKKYILGDAGVKILFTDHQPDFDFGGRWEILSEELISGISVLGYPAPDVGPHDLLYVIYTSGSTGNPKGVLIEHAAMLNYVRGMDLLHNTDDINCYGTVTDISTDAGNTAIYGALCSGKTLDIIAAPVMENPAAFFAYCKSRPVDAIKFTPSFLKGLLEDNLEFDWSFNLLLIGGESLGKDLSDKITGKFTGKGIYNHYGPTETTIGVVVQDLLADLKGMASPPIGRPLANTYAYILDAHMEPVPVGVVGELLIGGKGLARGYLNRPDLTAAKFIPNPFRSGELIYRTGDLARWLPDGKIEFLGRIDDQVKIRGYRIELGEIERVLAGSGLVKQSVIMAREDGNGDKRLVAYVVPLETFDRDEAILFLKAVLPEYMVPALWVPLDAIPLTANNKINRQALPEPELPVQVYVSPQTATEQALAGIWQELLKVPQIGLYDNFFDLGGHSLLAMRVLAALHKRLEVEISIRDIFTYPRLIDLAAHVSGQRKGLSLPALQVQERGEAIPLSFSQERLWFIDRLQGSVHYHIPVVLSLNGPLDEVALKGALAGIIDRHEVLRTVFREEEGGVYQQVLSADNWTLKIRDAGDFEHAASLQQWLDQELVLPFDLRRDYMLRASLVRYSAEKHLLVVVLHHIAADGWSGDILVQEFTILYRAAVAGHPAMLPMLPVQYADYAIWQRTYLTAAVLEEKLSWWTARLKGVIPLNLPTDLPRPAVQSTRGASLSYSLDAALLPGVEKLCRETGSTPFMVLLSIFKVLLYRYSGQTDICVGTPVAGRYHGETEGLIGFFLNTLALRSEVDADIPFIDFLQAERDAALAAYAHQEVPFEQVVERVVTERDLGRSPVFQVMFLYEPASAVSGIDLGALRVSRQSHEHTHTKFDLTFTIAATQDGYVLHISYSTDLYLPSGIMQLAGHYGTLLASALADPGCEVGLLPLLSAEEEYHLLEVLSGVTSPLLSGKGENQLPGVAPSSSSCDNTIVALFKAQVAKTPDNTAIVCGEQHLSYRELDRRATFLSVRLQQQGVQRGTIVALYLDRSVEFITGVLAILKAGGAYLPIDLSYPQQRVRYMLDNSGALLVLSTAATDVSFLEQPVLLADDESNYEERVVAINDDIQPGDLAYVIYTSGSTGQPKGVMIEHRNAVNYFVWAGRQYLQGEQLSFALYSSISFDLTCTSVFVPLLTGNTIHIYESAGDDLLIERVVRDGKAQVVKATPSHLKALLSVADVSGVVKRWIVGGEALSRELAASLRARFGEDSLIYNEYGPTETTIGCMVYEYVTGRHRDLPMVPIGQAAGNVRLYVLDSHRQLVPRGVSGELYIGGDGVGRGYINREDLSAERFMENPFHGGRLYRTGDLCRWLADGEMEYLGRIDEQVKVRGYRIEPGEIESVLTGSGLVREAAVMARQDGDGNNRLVAYITGDPDLSMVQRHLAACLPEYMVPSLYVKLAQLPLTANGKTDKQALPEPSVEMQAYVAPRTAVERELAGIWEELLHVEQVGLYDHFFLLGGHSLLAMRVVAALQKRLETVISIRDIFTYPRLLELASYIEQQHKGLTLPPLEVQERGEHIPLSFSQERLWFIDRLQGSVHYHIPVVLQLDGPLNIPALKRALWGIVDRHEVLRTVFGEQEGQAWQQVLPSEGWELKIYDASEVVIEELVEREQHHPFDLSRDYMLRASLIRETAQQHRLSVVLHHIASDGWSTAILVKEFMMLYRAAVSGIPVSLPVLPVQYADYAIWQRRYLTAELLEQKLDWWGEQLKGITPLNLPVDFRRPAVQSSRAGELLCDLDPAVLRRVQRISHETGSTPFMVLLSVFKILLQRYSGQTDICVGTPVAGRYHTETEGLIGFFLNTLALRSEVNVNQTFLEFLSAERDVSLAAYAHQEVPFEQVVGRVVTDRDMSRSPVFQVVFELQNLPEVPGIDLDELKVTTGPYRNVSAKHDLIFTVSGNPENYRVQIVYAADLYRPDTVKRMADHFRQLLQSAVTAPSTLLGKLKMLTDTEESQLLQEFNGPKADYPFGKTIIDLFEEQVAIVPDNIALKFEDSSLSYKELNARSNQLAHYLIGQGVKAESVVSLCMDRGADMIVCLLAILKAGGAYLPVDPDYPEERITYLLEDSGATLLISTYAVMNHLFHGELRQRVVLFDEIEPILENTSSEKLQRHILPEHLAYIIYTSGSTGRPKGVMIEHKGILNLTLRQITAFGLSREMSVLQFASLGFDASCSEIFTTLLSGATLIIPAKSDILSAEKLGSLIRRHKINIATLPPSYQLAIENELSQLQVLISAGEALDAALTRRVQATGVKVINAYGPTENTVCASLTADPIDENGLVSIGYPIGNVTMYILDERLNVQPVGVPGELYLGGIQVARGYLNRPELNSTKFISHPFLKGERLYRTGDIARWLPDGGINYLGRIDDQVKIRGYRIELGEIEHTMINSGMVKQAAVVVREDDNGNQRLIAYAVAATELDVTGMQEYLKGQLPDYMLPSFFVAMEEFPLTSSGKINRQLLPEPHTTAELGYVAPGTETERVLAAIWEELLDIEQVGLYDDFFQLGGHSLLAVRVMVAIQKTLEIEIEIDDLFTYPRLLELAAYIEQQRKGLTLPPLEVQERGEYIPLSFSQERLWFIDRLQGSVHYHIPLVLQLDGPLNIPALKRALWGIVDRHEVLRTVFGEQEGKAWQQVLPSEGWELKIYASEVVIEELLEREQHHPFDLSRDYMLRASLVPVTKGKHLLTLVLHHIAADGWSGGILVQELASLYRAAVSGIPVSLPVLPVQYADYAIWQRRYLTAELLEQKLGWWAEQLKGITPLNLPADLPRPGIQSTRGSASWYDLGITLTEGVDQLSRETGSTPFMVLLSVFKILLQRYSGQTDICVGTPVAGRYHTETEGLIGFFLNTLALRSEVNVNQTFLEFLSAERDVSLAAYAHQEVPFEQVVDRVETTRDMSRSPVFQVMFVLQNTPDVADVDLGALRVTPQVSDTTHVKQDLLFVVSRTAAGYRLHISYSTDLYLPATIERMAGHYQVLLQSAITGPSQELTALKMLSSAEEHWLLAVSHGTPADYPRDKTIVDLFAEQAAAVPDRIALVWEDVTLSYGELDARSNQLACYLRQKGVQPDTLVGICMHRGIDMIIGLLGILKAGGAYLPVDPDYPQDRIRYQLEDSGAALMITTSALATALFSDLAASRLILPERLPLEEMPSAPLPRIVQPEHLAYVIYTSGSTGKPKGVMIEHRQVVRLFVNDAPCYDFGPADTWTLFHSFCFDVSVWEIYGALLFGGKLIIVPSAVAKDSEAFGALLAAEEVTVLNQTPAAFYVLQEVLLKQRPALSLRYLIFAGEALQPGRLLQWQEAYEHCRLINMYGITEITVHATFKELHRSDVLLGMSNIGVAIPTLSALILDKWGHLSPVGCTGELYIGGDGLARGYLNRPELTASRFIADPFQSGGRLYRSGDLARRLANGEMEYQGRMDDQVKIRGYRIELGEIESVLSGSGLVHQSVVMAREDGNGGKRLVAYVVPVTIFDKEALTGYLKDRLPGYMVPSLWVALTSFPLTSNGKVDKRSLPEPEVSGADEYVGPRTATEQVLAGIWQELLGVERVGVYDNFFELGGDSIISIQVVSRAQRKGLQLKPRELFEHQTLEALAASIRSETRGSAAEQGVLSGGADLLPVQQLFFEQEYAVASHYNQSMLLEVSRSVAAEDLRKAVAAITAHHDVLRFTYQRSGGSWQQTYGSKEGRLEEADLSEVDLSALPVMIREVCNTYQQSLNLETGELCRWVLIHTPAGAQADRLFIVIHHLAVDGVSWRILLEDLRLCVEALSAGKEIDLGAKSSSYRQYGHALSAYARHGSTTMQQEYWATVIKNIRPLPVDFVSSSPLIGDVNTLQVNLGEGLTRSLLTGVHHAYQTEINDLLLSALSRTLQEWSGHEGVVIGLEGHGREAINEEIDTSRTVGWFTNIYPVLLSAGQGVSAADQIKSVKEQLRRLPGKGMGYSALRYLHPSAEVRGRLTPDFPFEILFNYLGQLGNVTGQDGWMSKAKEEGGATISADNRFGTRLAINAQVTGGVLQVRWSYAATDYQESTIRRLAEQYLHHLSALIRHCQEKETGEHTPSDFGLQENVGYEELNTFMNNSNADDQIDIFEF